MTTERWSLDGYARQYRWPQCRYCGRGQDHDCPRVECLLCGSAQCFGNGSTCSICHHGYLPGWSRSSFPIDQRVCGYAGCDHPAVARARKRPVCTDHAERIKMSGGVTLAAYVTARLAARDAGTLSVGMSRWKLVA